MLKTKELAYSVLSIVIPAAVYFSLSASRGLPLGISEARVFVPLLIAHAIGFAFSLIVLPRSIKSPTDTSLRILIPLFLACVGMFSNVVASEIILSFYVFH